MSATTNPATGKKRKSTDDDAAAPAALDTAVPTTKKLKKSAPTTTPTSAPVVPAKSQLTTSAKALRSSVAASAASLLDVSMVRSIDPSDPSADDDEFAEPLPVFDTCDTVRRKIRAILKKDGVTQAAFLRAITAAAYGTAPEAPKIQAGQLTTFLKLMGPLWGNTSRVFYAVYVFFKKLGVKEGKKKSKDREMIEIHGPDGLDVETNADRQRYWVCAGRR